MATSYLSEMEEWRVFPPEKHLEVSSFGRVRFIGSQKTKQIRPVGNGKYLGIVIDARSKNKSGKKTGEQRVYKLHRIIATLFVINPNPKKFNQINHIDGNKNNNRASNLEWCDWRHNIAEAIRIGLIKTKNRGRQMSLFDHNDSPASE